MEKKVVVMFPALVKPDGFRERMDDLKKFVGGILGVVPEAKVVPLLNGSVYNYLCKAEIQLGARDLCSPKITPNTWGLRDVLAYGYNSVCQDYPNHIIVRLDDQEHPLERIPDLMEKALEWQAMVIGDLEFDLIALPENTADGAIHRWIFPNLYRAACQRQDLGLSCAHGFQVFHSAQSCFLIMRYAARIIEATDQRLGKNVTWGWDGAMVVAAAYLERKKEPNVKVKRVTIDTTNARLRDPEKVRNQFANHLQICLAAEALFAILEAEARPTLQLRLGI